jgi:hypothetical protein
MTESLTMAALYRKLSKIGLKQNYVRKNGLPSWWDDELNDKPVAVLEGAGYIAKNLNLDLSSLLTPQEKVKFNRPPHAKFKQHNSQNNQHPYLAQALASRFAELISLGVEVNYTSLPKDAKNIREDILSHQQKVNLNSLLDYCWSQGIAVGYFDHFPNNTKKFAGLIQWHSTCPVIILSSKFQQSARLAFDLAHELGHLALAHLKDGVLVDEDIKFDNDSEEKEANQFATELLLGDGDNCFGNKKFKNVESFSKYVIEYCTSHYPDIDLGAIILNYGWHNREYFPLAMAALKVLEPNPNGHKIINKYLANQLNWDKFDNETYEYLEKVLGV